VQLQRAGHWQHGGASTPQVALRRMVEQACRQAGPAGVSGLQVLIKYGTEQQKEQWLWPLANGEIRSVFLMTGTCTIMSALLSNAFIPFRGLLAEPAVASSDATNISCAIVRKADGFLINGTKCAAPSRSRALS
jgi:alkylation response protein AidB-like acyl-CoA dehydrogenase